jgi:hypothetical protein
VKPEISASGRNTRVVALDTLRGLLLVMMGINHVPSDLQFLTNHPFGYVSSAEGFVFLSGLVGGLVYTRRVMQKGWAISRQTCWKRARQIYAYHLAAYFLVFAWVAGFAYLAGNPPNNAPDLMVNQPWTAAWAGPLFLYQPSLSDLLPMYCLLLLLMPLVLKVLEAGRTGLVLAASFGLWAGTNFFLPQTSNPTGFVNLGLFHLGAWQLVFIVGAVFGQAWAHGRKLLPEPNRLVVGLMVALAALGFLVRHAYLPSGIAPATLDWLINKNNFAPLRLLNTGVVIYLCHLCLRRWPRAFDVPPLALLGQHSLTVFTVHLLAAYVIFAFPQTFAVTAGGRMLSSAIILATMFATAMVHARLLGARRQPVDDAVATGATIPPFAPVVVRR